MAVFAEEVNLAGYTTLRLGGPARRFVEATTEAELVGAVRRADEEGEPVLVLGGGSNLVVSDDGFPGTVVHVGTRGTERVAAENDTVLVRVQAGEDWDPFVARCVADGLSGVECLSGIPGRVGATPIQNVGAYGQDVSETIVEVRAYDRETRTVVALGPDDCRFTYRNSVFKGNDRYVVLDVTYALHEAEESQPIAYAELAKKLGVRTGDRVPLKEARDAVLDLRRGKGMVLDPADPDTRSAGSFFTNPVLDPGQLAELERRVAERLGPDVTFPRYPEDGGRVKTSAAWLIDRAGFGKGHTVGAARISTKHTLALTNPGGAKTADLLALAREVRRGVRDAFGVELVNEPVLVGVTL
ncbi:UDP-N-acetylmuramate dehydrogenase [Actinomadura hallensis]|uniref:UDP-N-acetylenolpyruvoylglucosamine reductase n=1 Tax=Actinomadura hallensis TaxID=337895 RepID=A0A543IM84_9ACTN|nr:UDP-N-acetylmuramate dehydrogenase [Actinomadura hallensis]TQM71693.1 UDP-N-acetylmuramate dehydrogenase [Actinomadura hallensis]HLV72640.1 UDP-N-acetylmuramate dehydrogenase [Vulgatibacteraceae bacterium]